MYKYKGVIFDLDGTLLDSIQDISDSMNEVLTKFAYPSHSYEDYKLKVGNGFKDLVENSLPKGANENIVLECLDLFIKNYSLNFHNKTSPYAGVYNLLDELNKMTIKMGVNSNKRDSYTKQLVSKFFDPSWFVEVFGERQGIPRKPDPSSALEIANLMGLTPKEILYIGDSKTDIETSKNAGMDSIGVLWGFRSKEELSSYKATYIASHANDILNIIKGGHYIE